MQRRNLIAGAIAVIAFAAAVFLWRSKTGVDHQRVYRIGYGSDFPYHFMGADGKPAGLAVDIVSEAARRRGIKLAWRTSQTPGMPAIQKGEVDFWVLLTIRPERRSIVHLTEPYLVADTCFLVPEAAGFKSVQDFAHARISLLDFDAIRRNFRSLLPEATVVPANSSTEAVAAIREGRADAAYLDQYPATAALLAGAGSQPMRMLNSGAPSTRMGIASSFAEQDIADELRDAIRSLASGQYLNSLVQRWGFFSSRSTDAIAVVEEQKRWNRFLSVGIALLLAVSLVVALLAWRLRRERNVAEARKTALEESVAQRIRGEEERRNLEQQLQQAQRLESIGRLAGGIAHDFNNLLTVINGYSQLLISRSSPGDPNTRRLGEIHKAGRRAAGLTQQLLAFSRRQVIAPRSINLNTAVREILGMLHHILGEDIRIDAELAADLGLTLVDPDQMHQVIMNLVVNARDAMPHGGRLLLETQNLELAADRQETHPEMPQGAYVMLAVSDTGEGMDAATLQSIFEPFFTTKERGRGTGLGLATVHGIVRQSGGWIWVYSEPGKGTTFKIYLPRAQGAAEDHEAPAEHSQFLSGGETILVTEDQSEVRCFAVEVLTALGYRVLEAASAEDAIHLAGARTQKIDLLLTDVVLPGMNGPQLVQHMQSEQPGLKVLYTSGYTENAVVHRGVLKPGFAYLPKPFTPEGLAAKVSEVLGRR